jgi:hypothetical protein
MEERNKNVERVATPPFDRTEFTEETMSLTIRADHMLDKEPLHIDVMPIDMEVDK